MTQRQPPRPTDAELGILRVLWKRGPSTVREARDDLAEDVGYTTVLKLLQIMTQKGLVERDVSGRAHVYRARLSEQKTQTQLLDHLADRAFGGSAARLALRALSSRSSSPEELAEIRNLIARFNEEGDDE